METKFNSQICTTMEQSERLIALGLNKETADCALLPLSDKVISVLVKPSAKDIKNTIPAWSLHRLLSLIPKELEVKVIPMCGRNYAIPVELEITCELDIRYNERNNEEFKGFYGADIYDSAIRCLEWLIKEGYFDKNYLV